MNLVIKGRLTVKDFDPGEPFVVISICAPCYEFADMPEAGGRLIDVLRLSYDDVEAADESYEPVLFTPELARRVLDFVERHKDRAGTVVCQCDAGVSRSSATAAALSRIYRGDDDWVFQSPRYMPNRLVYRTILEAYRKERD
ncbi:MAG: hypothetical protein KKB20_22120 [Proteobacteria bacterium]|nr:hypothetical protein [Pseudomonadota bacterium]